MASKNAKVGFVGGMDIPLIRRFACGYEQGVKFINPGAQVYQNMTGSTPAAWNDPAKGAELAKTSKAELARRAAAGKRTSGKMVAKSASGGEKIAGEALFKPARRFTLDDVLGDDPDAPEAPEIARRVEEKQARWNETRRDQLMRSARSAMRRGSWDAALVLATRAERFWPEDAEALSISRRAINSCRP